MTLNFILYVLILSHWVCAPPSRPAERARIGTPQRCLGGRGEVVMYNTSHMM